MRRILTVLAALIAASVFGAAPASAQVVECQVSGVLVIIALNGPVTVCSFDTNDPNTNNLDPNISLLPIHL